MMLLNEDQPPFNEFTGRWFMLLTTFRRDGTPVPTPVGVYAVGDDLYFMTDPRSGKAKRIRHNPHVTIAPCTLRGAPVGQTHHARARAVCIEEAEALAQEFAGEHPITFHLGRMLSDLRGRSMTLYKLDSRAFHKRVAA